MKLDNFGLQSYLEEYFIDVKNRLISNVKYIYLMILMGILITITTIR